MFNPQALKLHTMTNTCACCMLQKKQVIIWFLWVKFNIDLEFPFADSDFK